MSNTSNGSISDTPEFEDHMMQYRSIGLTFGCLIAAFAVLASCSTTSGGRGSSAARADAGARQAEAAAEEAVGELDDEGRSENRPGGREGADLPSVPAGEDVPDWIETYPSDEDYYIGIGGFSGSDDRAELLEQGRLSALRALAGEISTEISSELRAVTREDSEGGRYDSSTLIMNAMVAEELAGVEVVDSYYSESIGQWFYLRLSKEEFRRYQREEITRIEQRLENLLSPVAGSPDVTATQELATLLRALGIAADSPYGGEARLSVAGLEGYATDVIVTRIQTVFDGLLLRPGSATVSTLPGEPAVVTVSARTPGRPAGAGRLPFVIETADGRRTDVAANESGQARTTMDTAGMAPGTYPVTVRVSLEAVTAGEEIPAIEVAVPETSFSLEVRPLAVSLSVRRADGGRLRGMEGYLRELISESIPVSFTGGRGDGRLEFTVEHRELPENDYGIVFVVAHATLNAQRAGANVVNYRTPEVKEGGLDAGQALSRAVNKLQEHLAQDPEFDDALADFAEGR